MYIPRISSPSVVRGSLGIEKITTGVWVRIVRVGGTSRDRTLSDPVETGDVYRTTVWRSGNGYDEGKGPTGRSLGYGRTGLGREDVSESSFPRESSSEDHKGGWDTRGTSEERGTNRDIVG